MRERSITRNIFGEGEVIHHRALPKIHDETTITTHKKLYLVGASRMIDTASSLNQRGTMREVIVFSPQEANPTPNRQQILGERLRELRKVRGLAITQLAEEIEVVPNTVANIEKGRSRGAARETLVLYWLTMENLRPRRIGNETLSNLLIEWAMELGEKGLSSDAAKIFITKLKTRAEVDPFELRTMLNWMMPPVKQHEKKEKRSRQKPKSESPTHDIVAQTGLSTAEIARRAGVSFNTVNNALSGKSDAIITERVRRVVIDVQATEKHSLLLQGMSLGELLKYLRINAGLSLKVLCAQLRRTETSILGYEADQQVIPPGVDFKLIHTLDLPQELQSLLYAKILAARKAHAAKANPPGPKKLR